MKSRYFLYLAASCFGCALYLEGMPTKYWVGFNILITVWLFLSEIRRDK